MEKTNGQTEITELDLLMRLMHSLNMREGFKITFTINDEGVIDIEIQVKTKKGSGTEGFTASPLDKVHEENNQGELVRIRAYCKYNRKLVALKTFEEKIRAFRKNICERHRMYFEETNKILEPIVKYI